MLDAKGTCQAVCMPDVLEETASCGVKRNTLQREGDFAWVLCDGQNLGKGLRGILGAGV